MDFIIKALQTFNNRLTAAMITVEAESLGFQYFNGPTSDIMQLVIPNRLEFSLRFSTRQFSIKKHPGAWRVFHKLLILRLLTKSYEWTQVPEVQC